jgi:hypothetical protein
MAAKEEKKYTIEKSVEPSTVSVYQSSDSPITGLAATVIYALRPITNLLRDQMEKLVEAEHMGLEEAVGWVNLHILLIGMNLRQAGPGSIIAYSPFDQTLVTISAESTSGNGYSATHWMIQTAFIAVDDPTILAAREARRRENAERLERAASFGQSQIDAGAVESAFEDDDGFFAGFAQMDDEPPAERTFEGGEIWREAKFDDTGILAKIEENYRKERRLAMAKAAADIARARTQAARAARASADDDPDLNLDALFGDGDLEASFAGETPEAPKRLDARDVLNEKRTRELARYLIVDPSEALDETSAFFMKRGGVQRKFLGGGRGGSHEREADAKKALARELKNDLIDAGLDAETAKKFSAGFKAGDGSGDGFGSVEAMFGEAGAMLDAKGSNALHAQVMEACEAKAKKSYSKIVGPKGKGWDKVDGGIRGVLADLEFEGQYTGAVKAKLAPLVSKGDVHGLLEAMKDRRFWMDSLPEGVPATPEGKYAKRIKFLEESIKLSSPQGRKVKAKRDAERRLEEERQSEIAEAAAHREGVNDKAALARKKAAIAALKKKR